MIVQEREHLRRAMYDVDWLSAPDHDDHLARLDLARIQYSRSAERTRALRRKPGLDKWDAGEDHANRAHCQRCRCQELAPAWIGGDGANIEVIVHNDRVSKSHAA